MKKKEQNKIVMKKIIVLCIISVSALQLHAQRPASAAYVGQVFTVTADGSPESALQRERSSLKTRGSLFSANNYIEIDGETSPNVITVPSGDTLRLIVVGMSSGDPYELINLLKFELKKGRRQAVLQKLRPRGIDYDSADRVAFGAVPYATRSFLLSIPNLQPGEYCLYFIKPVPQVATFSVWTNL